MYQSDWPYGMNIFKKCYNFDNIFIFLSKGIERERERERERFFRNKWCENTYHGLKEKQRASSFSRPVAIMGLNGWKKAQCSFQSSYHYFPCYHLCFFHLDWWWNRPTWVLISKLWVCNIKELEMSNWKKKWDNDSQIEFIRAKHKAPNYKILLCIGKTYWST